MDIYQVLKDDHNELKILLNELLSLKDEDDYRFILIEEIRNLFIPHSRAEEAILYNTLRAINADKIVTFHGYQEHLEAEALLRTLQVEDKLSLNWKDTAQKLKESVFHHIEGEESEIFDEARAALTNEEAVAMKDAFLDLKEKVREEGFMKSTADLIVNMMPPRLVDKIKSFRQSHPELRS
jgi:hemerythrin superfamily protein